MKFDVLTIFPTCVYRTNLFRKLTKLELKEINRIKKNTQKNTGNLISKETYILEKPVFKKLKKELLDHVNNYIKIVPKYKDVKPYMTQSWMNWTARDQYHHRHEHPNSLISGVLYVDADSANDSIKFFKTGYERIKPEVTNYDMYNSGSWWFPVKTGDLIIFNSDLTHKVETKKGNNHRASLAFNCFIRGLFGGRDKLAELEVK